MPQARAYAAAKPKAPLAPFTLDRREPNPNDVVIDIDYCGVCHSDVHQARDEWGGGKFPMVPGHEVVGRITKVGAQVKKFKVGDLAGVGCMVDSCRSCDPCRAHSENYCEKGANMTYSSLEKDGKTVTQGGYSTHMVVHEDFALRLPKNLDLSKVAPLLCAGVTTFSPLRHWNVKAGQRVGVVGLGGLGHMGVKLAASMGAHVVVFSHSAHKVDDAKRLGAHEVIVTKDAEALKAAKGGFDFILDTVSAPHDLNAYLSLLKTDGAMVLVGLPDEPPVIQPGNLIMKRRTLAGSLIGGIKETQEVLDYCGEHNITSDVELIVLKDINQAFDRMVKGDVKYRFVIDMKKSFPASA